MAIQFKGAKPEAKTFTLLENGKHEFTVTQCEPDTTKAGDDCVLVTLKHDSGAHVFETMMFTEKTIWKWLQFVAACGQDPEKGEFDNEDAIGRRVCARIGTEKENKEKGYPARNRVESFIFETGDEI